MMVVKRAHLKFNTISPKLYMIVDIVVTIIIISITIYVIGLVVTWATGEGQKLSGLADATNQIIVPSKSLSKTMDSSYTYSVWINISDWNYRYGEEKIVLTRDDSNGTPCPAIVLDPLVNNIIVKTGFYNAEPTKGNQCSRKYPTASHASLSTGKTQQGLTYCCKHMPIAPGIHGADNECIPCADPPCSHYKLNDSGSSHKEGFENCCLDGEEDVGQGSTTPHHSKPTTKKGDVHPEPDPVHSCVVRNVPLQRWVSIIVSSTSRQTDVYLNGRLVESCLLPGVVKALNNGAVKITPDGGFKGSTSSVRYIDHAITPKDAEYIYSLGESGGVLGYFKDLFGVVITLKRNGEDVSQVRL